MSAIEKYAVGIDLGGTSIKLGVVSKQGSIEKKHTIDTAAAGGPESVIFQIKKGVRQLLEKEKYDIEGYGIGSPGVVSIKEGIVENPPNLPGWKKVNLGQLLMEHFKNKVFVENDANAAAIGELTFGAGKNLESFIMVTLGTGVGGGIILNKKIYRGDFGAAGEIGHITIDYKGPACNCGSFGCIETYAGNGYIISRCREELETNRESTIWDIIDNDLNKLTPKIIDSAAQEGDQYALQFIQILGVYIGSALASVSNLLDVGIFIVGGGVAGFGAPLFNSIEKTIRDRVLIPLKERVKVLPADLKNDAGILGASSLVFYNK